MSRDRLEIGRILSSPVPMLLPYEGPVHVLIMGEAPGPRGADKSGVPFLGEIPLHMEIREKSDAGLPVVATEPDGPHAKLYRGIAEQIKARLEGGAPPRAMPRIVIE